MSNPYEPPQHAALSREVAKPSKPIFATWRRELAVFLLVLPVIVSVPFHYWVFHLAGSWFVDTSLEPEHRAVHLSEMFVINLLAFAMVVPLPALALLYLDGYRRRLIGWLLVTTTALAFLGVAWFGFLGFVYIKLS